MSRPKVLYYVYIMVKKEGGQHYFGKAKSVDVFGNAVDPYSHNYLGSSAAIRKKGGEKYIRENYHKIILKIFKTFTQAKNFEAWLVDNFKVNADECFNKTLGGYGGSEYNPKIKNRYVWESKSRKPVMIDDVCYLSGKQAARILGIPQTTISLRCRSQNKKFINYKFIKQQGTQNDKRKTRTTKKEV